MVYFYRNINVNVTNQFPAVRTDRFVPDEQEKRSYKQKRGS